MNSITRFTTTEEIIRICDYAEAVFVNDTNPDTSAISQEMDEECCRLFLNFCRADELGKATAPQLAVQCLQQLKQALMTEIATSKDYQNSIASVEGDEEDNAKANAADWKRKEAREAS